MTTKLCSGSEVPVLDGEVGLDVEVAVDDTGLLHPEHTDLTLVQLANKGDVWLVNEGFGYLRWLTNPDVLKVGHNLQFDLPQLHHHAGLTIERGVYDTMVVEGLLNAARPKMTPLNLATLAQNYLGVTRNKEVALEFAAGIEPTPEMLEYAANDATDPLEIKKLQEPELARLQPSKELLNLEMNVVWPLAYMLYQGIGFDRKLWMTTAREKAQELEELELRLSRKITGSYRVGLFGDGPSINFGSPAQVKKALSRYGMDIPSLNANTLQELAASLPPSSPQRQILVDLITAAKLRKSVSTYGIEWLDYVSPVTKRLHSSVFQTRARTGRLASIKPKLDNIPSEEVYRRSFVADEGNAYIKGDFSQQEARINADISGEDALLDGFENGVDPYVTVARTMFYNPDIQKDSPERKVAKTIFLALSYGMGIPLLAYRLGCARSEAEMHFESFRQKFPKMYDFATTVVARAEVDKFSETLTGRRRWGDPMGPRFVGQMRNHPIQGTAADMLKIALVTAHYRLQGTSGFVINLVHDEINVECAYDDRFEIARILRESMLDAAAVLVSVKFDVDISIGSHWEGHNYE